MLKKSIYELTLGDRYRHFRFRCGILVYLAVLLFGSIPGARAELGEVATGLFLHTAAYGLITFLLFTGAVSRASPAPTKTFLIVALMGALDEMIQALLPYRTGSINDWLVDVNAAFIGLLVMQSNWFKQQLHAASNQA